MTETTRTRPPTPVWHRALVVASALFAVAVVPLTVGLFTDPRVLTGEPVWLKPWKFAVSSGLYAVTLAWLLPRLRGLSRRWQRAMAVAGWVVAVALVVEVALIAVQAGRGVRSHFNYTTAFDTALWSTMGVTIVCLWTATAVVAIASWVARVEGRDTTWALRLGLVVALAGMAVAFFMPAPTPDQLADLEAGGDGSIIGAHTVGAPDGGPGLPLVGWSSVAGDVRVPHFVGLHGIQVLIVLVVALGLLSRRVPALTSESRRARLVIVAGVAYAAVVGLLSWQALRGQSVARPDALTLAATGLVALATAAAAVWAWRRPSTTSPVAPGLDASRDARSGSTSTAALVSTQAAR